MDGAGKTRGLSIYGEAGRRFDTDPMDGLFGGCLAADDFANQRSMRSLLADVQTNLV